MTLANDDTLTLSVYFKPNRYFPLIRFYVFRFVTLKRVTLRQNLMIFFLFMAQQVFTEHGNGIDLLWVMFKKA